MDHQPKIRTARLLLRPYDDADAPEVQRLAGDARVADTTLTIPHPYPDGVAEMWIATHEAAWLSGRGAIFAITRLGQGDLVGTVGLTVKPELHSAELGYWIGYPFWGHGYGTEAAQAAVDFGFAMLALDRVHAHHFERNPASGRVMQKVGMREEFFRRAAVMKRGVPEDVRGYAISRAAWENLRLPSLPPSV
ncbi:MAG: GNAT family N-acetyltransferase [Opitutaceae bacterium]|nr:GNAT family N-acetyltransferase [Opitutaceae bacterium]